MSQIVNQPESEYLAFDYMKEQYENNGNAKMAEHFKKLYIFENSAHSPLYEEYDKAKQVLAEIRANYY